MVSGGRPVAWWLYAVAERRLADEARRRASAPESLPLEEALEPAAPPGAVGVAEAVVVGVGSLPVSLRAVAVLRLLNGLAFAEIGACLQTSEAASRARFAQAIVLLQAALEAAGFSFDSSPFLL